MSALLPDYRRGRSLVGREELTRKLTGMAADVVRECHVELALGWLWSNRSKDALPDVPRDLFETLMFVRDQGRREVEAAYTGQDYFEDCLRLALRNSPKVSVLKSRTNVTPDRGALRGHPVVLGP